MNRRAAALAAALLLAGCLGPRYRPAPVVPAGSSVGMAHGSDSTRAFFDSLATERAADTTLPRSERLLAPRHLTADSVADLAWLDLLHDTTLTRLVGTALRQNRDVEAARARVAEFRAEEGAAFSALYPSLALNGSASRNKVAFGATLIPPYSAWRGTADLSWELDFWAVGAGVRAARADLASQEAAERATLLTLVSDVATGYLQLLELDQEQAIAEQTLSSRQATLALAQQRFARGLISELDVRQFEAQVAVPAVRLAQVQQARTAQEHYLNVLLGEGPMAIPRGGSLAAAAGAVVVPDSVPASLLSRRPDVVAAERAYAAATARVGVAEAARLPNVFVTGSYGTQALRPDAMFTSSSRIYQGLIGVSIPLFTGGRLVDQSRAARAQAEQARAAYEQTVLVALGEAGNALAGVRAARDVAAADETQAAALTRALDLAELRYSTGVANYLEVLDAERSLFDAQLAASQAQLQQLTAAVELYKALGGSWPAVTGAR